MDFKNGFSLEYIPSGNPVFVELLRYFKSDGGKCDAVLGLNKSLNSQVEDTCLWYENLQNGLLYHSFVVSKLDPCVFMSKTIICVLYVDDFMFWARSQSDIDNSMKSFKEDGTSYNW